MGKTISEGTRNSGETDPSHRQRRSVQPFEDRQVLQTQLPYRPQVPLPEAGSPEGMTEVKLISGMENLSDHRTKILPMSLIRAWKKKWIGITEIGQGN